MKTCSTCEGQMLGAVQREINNKEDFECFFSLCHENLANKAYQNLGKLFLGATTCFYFGNRLATQYKKRNCLHHKSNNNVITINSNIKMLYYFLFYQKRPINMKKNDNHIIKTHTESENLTEFSID